MTTNQLWFLNTRITIRVSASDGQDGISIIEHDVRPGDSPPLHVHRTEDEIFHILAGEFRVKVGDDERRVGPGDIMLVPKGVPHTYRVESAGQPGQLGQPGHPGGWEDGGRFLTVTAHGDFERFVRAMGRPVQGPGLPEFVAPSPEAIEALTTAAARFGIEIVGPPLS